MSTATVAMPQTNIFDLSFPSQVVTEMHSIHDEIAREAYRLSRQPGHDRHSAVDDWLRAETSILKPVAVTLSEGEKEVVVVADVPGFSIGEIKVHAEGTELRICGETKQQKAGKAKFSLIRKICRQVTLPFPVDAEKATSNLDKGVLTLHLPKATAATA